MTLDIGSSLPVGGENRRIQVELPKYGATIWVEYDQSKYDWRIEKVLVQDADTMPAWAVKEFLQTFVVDWELFENGVFIDPKQDETYRKLDLFNIQMPIAWAIVGDMGEGKTQRNASPQPSSTEPVQPPRSLGRDRLPAHQ